MNNNFPTEEELAKAAAEDDGIDELLPLQPYLAEYLAPFNFGSEWFSYHSRPNSIVWIVALLISAVIYGFSLFYAGGTISTINFILMGICFGTAKAANMHKDIIIVQFLAELAKSLLFVQFLLIFGYGWGLISYLGLGLIWYIFYNQLEV